MYNIGSRVLLFTIAGVLSGCNTLPTSGPSQKAVEANAYVKVGDKAGTSGLDYALVDINANLLKNLTETKPGSLSGSFGAGHGGAPAVVLGVGDSVQVTIFEAQAGGLFIPSDAGSRPGNYITMPTQTIDRSGLISVPYAGKIHAANRPVEAVQTEIERLLANRAIEPQVVISTVTSRSMQVSVLGDVQAPKKVELSPAGERVVDVISEAGGLSAPGIETTVTLQRGQRSVTVPYALLSDKPAENIFVRPGDTIFVNRERRTFLAFGASGQNGRFDFEESGLSLGEALAKAGGLLDNRAEPGSVLVYRSVSVDLLRKLGVNTTRFTTSEVPVIFRANLRDPAAFFAVQNFPMQNKDIIFVSNAESVEVVKFLTIVNSVTSTAAGASQDVVDTKNNVR